MYRITEDMAQYISSRIKNPDVPGLQKDKHRPFTPRNKYSVGVIDRAIAYNTDALYLLEADIDMKGFFLYRNGELNSPDDKVEVPRAHLDPHSTNLEEMLDVSDCTVELPDQMHKLTDAVIVKNIDDLFEKEPELKLCLNLQEEKKDGKGFFRKLLKISTFGFFK